MDNDYLRQIGPADHVEINSYRVFWITSIYLNRLVLWNIETSSGAMFLAVGEEPTSARSFPDREQGHEGRLQGAHPSHKNVPFPMNVRMNE
jgi:hypothetical protein